MTKEFILGVLAELKDGPKQSATHFISTEHQNALRFLESEGYVRIAGYNTLDLGPIMGHITITPAGIEELNNGGKNFF